MSRIFLVHSETLPQLRSFEKFLKEVIQVEPILLEDQDPLGLNPGPRSEHYMETCEGIIFLLTRDLMSGDEFHPRSSVSIEMPIAEKKFPPAKRFYMIEQGVKLSSMVDAPNRISFTWDDPLSFLDALVKLTRYLRGVYLAPPVPTPTVPKAVDGKGMFVLDLLANSSNRWLPTYMLSGPYMQKFQTNQADFHIVVASLQKKSLIDAQSAFVPSPNRVSTKHSGFSISAGGLELLEKTRSERGTQFVEGLHKLGLVPIAPENKQSKKKENS